MDINTKMINELDSLKHGFITYMLNLITLFMASFSFLETADILLKIISIFIALVVLYFTRRRLKKDLHVRDIEIQIKQAQLEQEQHRLYILMEESKKKSQQYDDD